MTRTTFHTMVDLTFSNEGPFVKWNAMRGIKEVIIIKTHVHIIIDMIKNTF